MKPYPLSIASDQGCATIHDRSERAGLFAEFIDHERIPASIRATLREILECGNARPFRSYYRWVASRASRAARERGCATIVELGAGSAPLTRHLAATGSGSGMRLVPCDLHPDRAGYAALEARYPGLVVPEYASIDYSKSRSWGGDALLLLSATLHHIPANRRRSVVAGLASSGTVLIAEPLGRNTRSCLFVLLSIIPSLLAPLFMLARPGRARRMLWCWLMPVAPVLFVCDGLVSCLRQWTPEEWHRELEGLRVTVTQRVFSQEVLVETVAGGGRGRPR